MSDVGIFRTTIQVAPLGRRDDKRELREVMVDTGSEYNWIPRATLEELGIGAEGVEHFETADGRVLTREIGWAILHAGGRAAPTIVVFAEKDDMVLLGALGLESMNLRVDLPRKQLVPAGPVPVAGLMSYGSRTAASFRRADATRG
jgi:predicted aspartyl protease